MGNTASSLGKRDLQSEYKLRQMLGKGGFGRVFSAVRLSDGLEVAVKEVIKDTRYQDDNKVQTDIPTEVALMQQVQNIPGVIRILDYIDDTDSYYIVMERINSKDLFDFITEEGPLPERFASKMFSDIVKTVIISKCLNVKHQNRISLDSILSHAWFQQRSTSLKVSTSSSSLMSTSPATSSTTESSIPMITDSPMTSSHSLIVMTV